jgi:hypothetical protein
MELRIKAEQRDVGSRMSTDPMEIIGEKTQIRNLETLITHIHAKAHRKN